MKKASGTKKTLSKTGPGSLRISGLWPREREDFPIIYVFSPPRFFALQQIKRNPHPWGTLLDYSLFSSCFHGSPFAFHPARACARGYAWQIAFPSCALYVILHSRKRNFFFFLSIAKFFATLGLWRIFDWRCRDIVSLCSENVLLYRDLGF